MARYRAKWPLDAEARLMFDILHYTFLRLGDGDVRLDRSEDARALHRAGKPGGAWHQRHGKDRRVRSEPVTR